MERPTEKGARQTEIFRIDVFLNKKKDNQNNEANANKRGLQVKTGGENDVALDEFDALAEFVLQLRVADALGGLDHLAQQLLQPPHAADDAAFEDVGHFADLTEGGAAAPGGHDVHHERLELLDVGVLVEPLQFGLQRHLGDAPRQVLHLLASQETYEDEHIS